MTNLELTRPLAIIDIETTGLNPQIDRIIEICIIKIFPGGREEVLNLLINPELPIPQECTEIHNITDADVQGQPIFREVAQKIADFLGDCDLCGFGIIRFDVPFLEFEFKRAGLIFSEGVRKIVDVKSIYHKLEPRDLNSAHIKYCGKPLENVHRANRDARATIEILKSQLNQHINLPKDILGLERFSNPRDLNWIDDQGKLAWHNEKTIITFGKNKGKTLEELYKNDPSYFQWILNADFSPQVKEIIKEAAEGRFPKQKEIADE